MEMVEGIQELGGAKLFKEKKEVKEVPWLVYGVSLVAVLVVGWLIGVNNGAIGVEAEDIDLNGFQTELGSLKRGQLALANNQNILLASIVNTNLCGANLFVPDSNMLVDSPRGIVYSCFAEGVSG